MYRLRIACRELSDSGNHTNGEDMTLAEAQARARQRQAKAQAWHALGLALLTALLFVACAGCLVSEIKTPVVDFGLDVHFHKPEWVLLRERYHTEARP